MYPGGITPHPFTFIPDPQKQLFAMSLAKSTNCLGCDGDSNEHSCKPQETAITAGNFLTNDAMKIFGEAMAAQMTTFHAQQMVLHDKKMDGMASLFSSKLNAVDARMDAIEQKLNNVGSTTANSSDSMFLDRVTSQVWPIIPNLCCGETGVCAWIPVTYEDEEGVNQDVVVISLRMLQWAVPKYNGRVNKTAIKCCFDSLGTMNIDIKGSGRSGGENFSKIMKKTPFRTYIVGGKNPYAKSNLMNYTIVSVDSWKSILSDIDRIFPNRPKSKIVFDQIPNERVYMTQRFSMKAVSKKDSRTCKIKEFGKKQFDIDVRKAWPAMFVKWWSELYTPLMRSFFDIPIGEIAGQVFHGKYLDYESPIKSFEQTFDRIFPNKPELKYEILEDSDDEESGSEDEGGNEDDDANKGNDGNCTSSDSESEDESSSKKSRGKGKKRRSSEISN